MKSFDSLIGPAARAAMRDDRRIRSVISRIVPAGALEHVTFCRLVGRQLRVTLDGAAWVPKLRFCERTLLAALLRDGLDVRTVSWHVTPVKTPAGRVTAKRSAQTASPRAARAVLSAAAAFDDHGDGTTSGRGDGGAGGGGRSGKRSVGDVGNDAGTDGDGDGDELSRQMRRMARNLVGRAEPPPSED